MTGLVGGLIMGILLLSVIGLIAFLVLKSLLSFTVLRAFAATGPGSGPFPANPAAGFAMVRALFDLPMLAIVVLALKQAKWMDTPMFWPIVFTVLCAMRVGAWWAVGLMGTQFRGRKLKMLVALGVGVDVMFDGIALLFYFAATRAP
jgi:hypothetical protein